MAPQIILSPKQKQEIIRLYKEKSSINRIHKLLKINHENIEMVLRESHIKIKKNNSLKGKENIIAELYQSGKTVKEISKTFKVSSDTITRILISLGIVIRNNFKLRPSKRDIDNPNFTGFSQEQLSEIIDKYKSGISAIKLSKEYDISNATLCRFLRKQGIERNYYSNLTLEIENEILKLYQQGTPMIKITDKFHVANRTIKKLLLKQGIKPRIVNDYRIKRRLFSPQVEKQITDEYLKGTSFKKLAAKYQCNDVTIAKIVKRNSPAPDTTKVKRKDKKNKNLKPEHVSVLPEQNQNDNFNQITVKTGTKPVTNLPVSEPVKIPEPVIVQDIFSIIDVNLKGFFDRYKINLTDDMLEILMQDIPSEFLEEYLIQVKDLTTKNKFIPNHKAVFMNSVFKENNIVQFLQKIDGKMKNREELLLPFHIQIILSTFHFLT